MSYCADRLWALHSQEVDVIPPTRAGTEYGQRFCELDRA